MTAGASHPAGSVGLTVVRSDGTSEPVTASRPPLAVVRDHPARELTLAEIRHHGLPRKGLPAEVNRWRRANARHLARGARRVLLARSLRLPHFYGQLYLTLHRADGQVHDLGLASMRVVTTAGVNFLVDALQGSVEPELLRFHALGTGTNAEASADTALQTELAAQYNPDGTRVQGSLGEGAAANVFRTTATTTPDAGHPIAVTEHGVLSQAATGGGTLLDRSVFAAVNLTGVGDSLTSQYDWTLAAGG